MKNSREVGFGIGPVVIGDFGSFFFDLGIYLEDRFENRPEEFKIYFVCFYAF